MWGEKEFLVDNEGEGERNISKSTLSTEKNHPGFCKSTSTKSAS